jgi:hypothetical protein
MHALIAAIVLQGQDLPENPNVDYSGIPQVTGASTSLVSHSATIELYKDYAMVSSVTQVRNLGGAGAATLTFTRGRVGDEKSGAPNFPLTVTWNNKAVALSAKAGTSQLNGKHSMFSANMWGKGAMVKGGSYSLKVSYRVPLGRAGFDRKQYLAAYDIASAPVGVANITYKFAKGVVFRLPEPKPDLGWQVGARGAFVRLENYDGGHGLTFLNFYSGGFENIGSTGGGRG